MQQIDAEYALAADGEIAPGGGHRTAGSGMVRRWVVALGLVPGWLGWRGPAYLVFPR